MRQSDPNFKAQRVCVLSPLSPNSGSVSLQGELFCRELANEGARVFRVNTDVPSVRLLPAIGSWLLPMVQFLVVLSRLLWCLPRCDVVHIIASGIWGFFLPVSLALPLARFFRRRVVLSYFGAGAARLLKQHSRLAWPLLRNLDDLAASSHALQEVFAQYGLSPRIIPPMIDLVRFPFLARDAWSPLLLWHDEVDAPANPLMAVRALAELHRMMPEARLLIVGEGPLVGQVATLARDLGVAKAIAYRPVLPEHKLRQTILSASVVWHTASEGELPQVLMEAAAVGSVIISTRVGAIPELIHDGVDGLLVEPDDHEALAACTTQVLRRAVLANGLANNARLAVERFSWPGIRGDVARLYGLVADDRRISDEESGIESLKIEFLRPETTPPRGAEVTAAWSGPNLGGQAEVLRADPAKGDGPTPSERDNNSATGKRIRRRPNQG